jgi:4-hydroxy-3-methylbut-2-enyl diphosphate reductase
LRSFASIEDIAVVTATRTELNAARRALPGVRVVHAGVSLARMRGTVWQAGWSVAISCGLAGGVRRELGTGTVVVPREVLRPDGTVLACSRDLSEALIRAARELGIEPVTDPIVTTDHVVTGEERATWAARGFAGVDMETGLLNASRIGAVRVLLDTPLRELSEEWLHPRVALFKPRLWREALWLARHAPRCAELAAAVVGRALAEATSCEGRA